MKIRPLGAFSAVLVTLSVLSFGIAAASASSAKTGPSRGPIPNPAPVYPPVPWPHRHGHGHTWHTCVPQATLHVGIYQFDNDLFSGKRGRSCVTVIRHSITIDSNYRSQGSGVVAYPVIRIGDYPWNRDPGSGLPAPVGLVQLRLRIRNTGSNPGAWIDDVDTWFGRTAARATHHIREMIIVTRWSNYYRGRLGRVVRIGRRYWYVTEWKTGPRGHMWPLIRIVARHQTNRVTINMAAFLKVARHHHWISADMVLSSVSDGSECWSGCHGLTDGMTVTGIRHRHHRMPKRGPAW